MSNIRDLEGNVNIIGKNLKRIRKNKKVSQTDLCRKLELLGVPMFRADIYEIEHNKRLVKDFEVKAICLALSISTDELYSNTNHLFGL